MMKTLKQVMLLSLVLVSFSVSAKELSPRAYDFLTKISAQSSSQNEFTFSLSVFNPASVGLRNFRCEIVSPKEVFKFLISLINQNIRFEASADEKGLVANDIIRFIGGNKRYTLCNGSVFNGTSISTYHYISGLEKEILFELERAID